MDVLKRLMWPIVFCALGIGVQVWTVVGFIRELNHAGVVIAGPGASEFAITVPGEQMLWHEYKSIVDGVFVEHPKDLPAGTKIVVTAADGTDIPLTPNMNTHLSINSVERTSIGNFQFPTAGAYTIDISGLPSARRFYLSDFNLVDVILGFTISGLGGMLCLMIGIGWAIYALVRLPKKKRTPRTRSPDASPYRRI
jgi:hypothetical protein